MLTNSQEKRFGQFESEGRRVESHKIESEDQNCFFIIFQKTKSFAIFFSEGQQIFVIFFEKIGMALGTLGA